MILIYDELIFGVFDIRINKNCHVRLQKFRRRRVPIGLHVKAKYVLCYAKINSESLPKFEFGIRTMVIHVDYGLNISDEIRKR